jgi:hypothetical protein
MLFMLFKSREEYGSDWRIGPRAVGERVNPIKL